MQYFDVTVPIRAGMPVYLGDPRVEVERYVAMTEGGTCNLSRIEFGVHSGTHIDAPLHFIDGAPGIEATPLDALLGPVEVVDATAVDGDIDEAALARLSVPSGAERIVFKTRNSALWKLPEFSTGFIGLTEGAARTLAARGLRLAGIDYLSIAPLADPAPAHIELLGKGVVVLEGLDLSEVSPGRYDMVCLPMLIAGSDGAPARVLLRRE